MQWPEHKGELHITHNPQRVNYETAEQYLDSCDLYDLTPEERQSCIDKDSIWEVQWYPHTMVGFCIVAASTFEEAVAKSLSE